MDLETIQAALKEVFYSLGGSAESVRNTNDVNAILLQIAALGLGAEITSASAKELPAFPDTDGTYTLQLVMDDGEATLTWEAAGE